MNNMTNVSFGRYNKATAAAASQAIVQLIAAFVQFPPEMEQAMGIIMTSLMVWLVPNQDRSLEASAGLPVVGDRLVAHLPLPAALAAIAVSVLLAGCASLISSDTLADRVLGPDCGPESRVYRTQSLMVGLGRAYPALQTGGMRLSLASMERAAASGGSLDAPAAAFQDALVMAMAPVVLEAGRSGEPIWLSLAQLPPAAAEVALIRQKLVDFCARA